MLEEQRGARFGLEGENAARGAITELERLGEGCGFAPGNLLPPQDQGRVGETRADESCLACQSRLGAEGRRSATAG